MSRIFLRDVDKKKHAQLKAEAAKQGITLGQAFNQAIEAWMKRSSGIDPLVQLNNITLKSILHTLPEEETGFVVVTQGKFLGVFETLEKAWEHMNSEGISDKDPGIVQSLVKTKRVVRLRGSSLKVKKSG